MGFSINQFLRRKEYEQRKDFEKRAKAFSDELKKLCDKYGLRIQAKVEIADSPIKVVEKEIKNQEKKDGN